jgi:hypothetical protein
MGLSFPGVLPLEHHAMAACGCEEGDGGLLRRVVQVAKVAYLADVGDGGHRGGSKGRHAEQSPDDISTAQAVLSSGVAAGSGWGWLDWWTGGWEPAVCSYSEPFLCAASSHCRDLPDCG